MQCEKYFNEINVCRAVKTVQLNLVRCKLLQESSIFLYIKKKSSLAQTI